MKRPIVIIAIALLAPVLLTAQYAPGRMEIDEFRKLHAAGKILVVDVRDELSFRNGHIPGSINVPLGEHEQAEHFNRLKAEKRPIITYCAWPDEATSARAALAYMAAGIKDVKALKGGWAAWLRSGGATETAK